MKADNNDGQPWWNDSDKVAGLLTTIVMVGLVASAMLLAVAGSAWLLGKAL